MNKGSLARKVGLAVIATLTALAGLAPFITPGAGAAENYTQVRYDGVDRFDTAALIASAIAEATPTAVLARADDYPDALVGAYVASNADSPILLTQTNSVPQRTLDALRTEGVQNIILLGGPAAISQAVQNQLTNEGYNVTRIQGATRYHTAIAIARAGQTVGTIDGQRTALVSSAVNFPDALSGAPLSFAANLPSLLVPRNLDGPAVEEQYLGEVIDAMNQLNIERIFVLGGPAAVDQAVEARLVQAGFDVARLQGANRGATSVEIFEFGLEENIYTNRRFGLARGDNFPDALAYAPLAGRDRTSDEPDSGANDTGGNANGLLLANGTCDLHDEVENFIAANSDTWTEGEILGGPNAICPELAALVADLASVGLSNITLDTTNAAGGDTITGNIEGEDVESLRVSGCGLSNEDVDIAANGDFEITIPNDTDQDCSLTFTTTYTAASGRSPERQTFQINIDAPAQQGGVTLNPASGPSGGSTTATYAGDRPARITDISSTNCTIGSEGTQNNNRTFTVTGANGTTCQITTTVTYTDAEGGTDTFTDTYTVTGTGTAQAAPTVRPELINATLGATSTTGTLVTYCFDEEITGTQTPAVAGFHLYPANGDTQYDATGTPVITTNNCVQVNFADITTASNLLPTLTLATVEFGAVMDNEGSQNPIGDAPVGSGQQVTLTAGTTDAPDLLSVTGCAAEPATGTTGADTDAFAETRCTFTFDEKAYTVTPAGFHLVLVTGEQINCVALSGVEGGQPADPSTADADTTIVAECQQTANSGIIATTAIARGFVDPNTVSDAQGDRAERANNNEAASDFTAAEGEGCDAAQDDAIVTNLDCVGNLNPLQATDNPDGETPEPDLVSATLGANTDTANDTITYTFDETVQAAGLVAADFCYYEGDGDFTCGTATSVVRGANDTTVIATFAEGTLNQAVGASVVDDAVRDVNGLPNEEDEEGMANSNQSATAAGRTDNPDLIGVAVQTVTTGTGSTFRAIYTFDEDLDAAPLVWTSEATAAQAGDFFLYASDGTRYVATACETRVIGAGSPAGTEDTDNTVVCTEYAIAAANDTATTVSPTDTALMNAVLGTVDDGAVTEEGATNGANPEGAELVTGGTGSPTA